MSSTFANKSTSKYVVILSWVLVAAWACFIFFASAHTGQDFDKAQDLLTQAKKVIDAWLATVNIPGLEDSSSIGHFCEYTLFGFLLANALHFHFPAKKALVFALAIVIASLYGVSDEFHQLYVPGRACDPADWMVDTLGATLGSGIRVLIWSRKWRNPQHAFSGQ